MSSYLDLYDYRRRVASLYRARNEAFLAGEDAERIWLRFRAERDQLFARHPQTALDEEQLHSFQGLPYFPYQPDLRFAVDIDTDVSLSRLPVAMNTQEQMMMVTIGYVHLSIDGQPVTLSLYWLEIYGGGLFLPFHDTTCPQESYGGGRYLFDTIKGSDPLPARPGEKQIVLDFNYAYNPSCAYNARWVCPLAPQENYLPVAMRAGEKKYV